MKFRPKWLLIPLGLAVAGMASAHWTLSGEALREEVADQVMQTAGLRANAQGKASFAVLPRDLRGTERRGHRCAAWQFAALAFIDR